ncbi:MAG TPA: DUF1697 domain-containing protein [Rhodothermales bacterium]|nr:DUF1697 domain-containing protein [Rhodothermales bacterium]
MRLIILLRGINVGSTRSLPMKELVDILRSFGLEDVATYIQSGNVVARSSGEVAPDLTERIAVAIEERKGFKPQVLVLSADQLKRAIASNPFPEAEADPRRLHVFFLASRPAAPDLESLEKIKGPTERFELTDAGFYLHTPDGFGTSKLAGKAERYLGVPATARNWRTVMKLAEMAGDL